MKPFEEAKEIARTSDFKRAKIGCVITWKKKVIAKGVNTFKTHPVQKVYNKERFPDDSPHCMHAETRAIIALTGQNIAWNRVHLYTYRELKDGSIAMSRPCPSCMKLIKDYGIKHIHYSTPDGYAHEVIEY